MNDDVNSQRTVAGIAYAPPRLRMRRYHPTARQRIRRVASLLAIGGVLAFAALWCTSDRIYALLRFDFAGVARGIRTLPAWNACARYSADGQVVYEEGPSSSREWITSGTFDESVDGNRLLRSAPDPRCLQALRPSPKSPGYSVLFLHGMRLKSGEHRLVVLDHFAATNETWPPLTRAYGAGGWMVDGYVSIANGVGTPVWNYDAHWSYMLGPRKILRIYAGQVDPADETHLTLPYEMDGGRGTIDAWLRGNTGHMHFVVRDGPGTRTDRKTQWD